MAKHPNRKKPSPLDNLPESPRYVSRGGDKLRGALDAFGVSVVGKSCLDVGASTGGFTDCLLQDGAKSVWAVDVGYGLLDFKLRNDPRIHVLERTNFRHMDLDLISDTIGLAVVDVSFISLDKIFPKIMQVLPSGGEALVLVKPQFEASPKEAPGGVVKDERVRARVLENIQALAKTIGFEVKGQVDSQVKGPKGNIEAFLYLAKA